MVIPNSKSDLVVRPLFTSSFLLILLPFAFCLPFAFFSLSLHYGTSRAEKPRQEQRTGYKKTF
jgi:hypothetical protein